MGLLPHSEEWRGRAGIRIAQSLLPTRSFMVDLGCTGDTVSYQEQRCPGQWWRSCVHTLGSSLWLATFLMLLGVETPIGACPKSEVSSLPCTLATGLLENEYRLQGCPRIEYFRNT